MKKRDSKLVTYQSHSHRYPTRFNLGRHASSSSAPPPLSMELRKKTTADGDDKPLAHHVWVLGPHSSMSSLSQVHSVEDKSKDHVLVASKRRKVERDTLYVPTDILYRILLLVSAHVLHGAVKFVCKQWYDIVSDPLFITTHLQLSSPGLLFQDPIEEHRFYYIEGNSSKLKKTEIHLPFPAKLLGSLNGLVLLRDFTNTDIFHVLNHVTKVKISLPPLAKLKSLSESRPRLYESSGFAVDSSGHYKVVHASGTFKAEVMQMLVFTLGVDKAWRFVDLQLFAMVSKEALLCNPCAIAGYIYWHDTTKCFALDVETETICQFDTPKDSIRAPTTFISMGTCPGLLSVRGEIYRFWKLIDVKSGEWAEVARINMLPMIRSVDKVFYPRKCAVFLPTRFSDGDIWYYRGIQGVRWRSWQYVLVCHNLASGSFEYFPVKCVFMNTFLHPHIHTLLSPKNC